MLQLRVVSRGRLTRAALKLGCFGVQGLLVLIVMTGYGCGDPETTYVGPEELLESKPAEPPPGHLSRDPAKPILVLPEVPDDAKKLIGEWRRPDGGYIIRITSVQVGGVLETGYFNPSPINVSDSKWLEVDGRIGVFAELRDTNYPGATYHLLYDSTRDALSGVYYQPVYGQEFEVVFERVIDTSARQ